MTSRLSPSRLLDLNVSHDALFSTIGALVKEWEFLRMKLTIEEKDGILVVRPDVSRIDATVAVPLKTELSQQVAAGHWYIAVDLGGVDFIDSSGLGALATVRKQLGGSGALALYGIQPTVKSMFKLTRMDKVFAIFDNEEDALSSIMG